MEIFQHLEQEIAYTLAKNLTNISKLVDFSNMTNGANKII
jgi:hypothetical protein